MQRLGDAEVVDRSVAHEHLTRLVGGDDGVLVGQYEVGYPVEVGSTFYVEVLVLLLFDLDVFHVFDQLEGPCTYQVVGGPEVLELALAGQVLGEDGRVVQSEKGQHARRSELGRHPEGVAVGGVMALVKSPELANGPVVVSQVTGLQRRIIGEESW